MCVIYDKDVEARVREKANKDGWITAYKVVKVRGEGRYTPIYFKTGIPFQKGENELPEDQRRRRSYKPWDGFGFHVFLNLATARTHKRGIRAYRIVKVRAHIDDLIIAGGTTINSKTDLQAAFRRITFPSFKVVPLRRPKRKAVS